MPEKKTFDSLLPEIKASIIDHVFRPTDLKNVCLVNKQLHEIAVKPLYRHVSLDLGSPNDTRLSAFLNPNNKGLKHIKQIRLYLASVRDGCHQKQQANFAARVLLEFLPEDCLEEFRWENAWCPWEPFSADNLMLLYKKQRRMKWLEVMDLDRDILPELKKNTKLQQNLFSHARKLALYPENRETLFLSGYFIENTADVLEELIIHANFDSHGLRDHSPPMPNTIDSRELNDSATAPGLLSSTLFAHMLPFDKCTPLKNLKSLRLHRISLRHCAETWCKFIDFTKLQYLRLYQCPGADTLFGQLCKSTNLPKQLKTLEFQHKDNSENEALLALDGFLCLVSGINDLIIDMEHVKALPAAAGIARHGKTLELLNVHCSTDCGLVTTSADGDADELVWDIEEFTKICKACTGLEQLSCAWPPTSLIRSQGEEWKAYESAAGYLRKLITLHISTFPHNKPSSQTLPKAIYEQLLQGLALRLFELPHLIHVITPTLLDDPSNLSLNERTWESKLRVIAFGISDKIYEREESANQCIFLRSTCQNCIGRTMPYATRISWCLRQFVEPRSDVLDFVLHRDCKTPWRDRDGPPTGWGEDDEFELN